MHIKKNSLSFVLFLLTMASFTKPQTITLFSHGIADTLKQAYLYIKSPHLNDYNERYLITTPFFSFNYPDAVDNFLRGNYRETSFGQANEINRLYAAYKKAEQKAEKKYKTPCDFILFGLSRGASNLAIFAGTHQLDNVKAIVLESPYDSMADVIDNFMSKLSVDFLPHSHGEFIAECIFGRYKRDGLCPRNCVENISKNIPILIICSKKDQLIPFLSSINVYKKLVASGHEHVYLFITDQGKHARILQGPDGEKYQAIVHAFYKKYNLPYDRSIAAKGKADLLLCQPIL